jgi:hypothetical protein
MRLEIAEIKMVESYMETLRVHPKGKICAYPLPKSISYNGFHNAKTRLKKIGREFEFEIIPIDNKEYLKVKRTK